MKKSMPLEKLGKVFWEQSPDAVVVVSAQGEIIFANPGVSLLGYTAEELVGKRLEVLVPPALREAHVNLHQTYMSSPTARVMGSNFSLIAVSQDGRDVPVDIALSPIEVDGEASVMAVIRDVSEKRAFEDKLRYLSFHDALTGVYNRAFLDEHIARLGDSRVRPICVMMADVDGLKQVNDTLGHDAGDQLLIEAASAIKGAVRVEDVVARLGGDEFVVVMQGMSLEVASGMRDRVLERAQSAKPRVKISIGIAVANPGDLLIDVVRAADVRMYEEKRARRAASTEAKSAE